MSARLASVVVGIDKVDPKAFQALESFADRLVRCQSSAHLRVVQRHSRKKHSTTIEKEVAAIDPELAESKALHPAAIEHVSRGVEERDLNLVDVTGRVNVPEFLRPPFFREG